MIIDNLQRTNRKFDDLDVEKQVPCVCEKCENEPTLFDYEKILGMYDAKRLFEWCPKLKGDVSLSELLQGVEHVNVRDSASLTVHNHYTNIDGNGNLVAQGLEHVNLDASQGVSNANAATKKDIATLHARHDSHDDRLRDIQVLAREQRELLSENARQINDQLDGILEKAGNMDQLEALVDIKRSLEKMKDEQEKAAVKKMLDDDRIDMTAKLKFVTPFYIRELFGVKAELEFAKKEKVPRTWAEFKALFVKKED